MGLAIEVRAAAVAQREAAERIEVVDLAAVRTPERPSPDRLDAPPERLVPERFNPASAATSNYLSSSVMVVISTLHVATP